MSGVEIALAAAALLVGFTGTWSPCGFSMVETIGPVGHTGGRRTTIAACATFLPGAIIGGAITFAALAWVGSLVLGTAGPLTYAIAATLAFVAAILEVRGTPIVPQIRRQLPEHWRRIMPMPLAAGLYGILLGLGFTTFVLSFGVWALAAIAFAVGDFGTGLIIGLAFGIGRGTPIVALAPLSDKPLGARITESMAIRPALYRGARISDAAALMLVAGMLGASGADAARDEAKPGADPGTSAGDLVYQESDGTGILLRNGNKTTLPGSDPAIGGGYIAVLGDNDIEILDATTLDPISTLPSAGVDGVAIAKNWLVYRTRRNNKDRMFVRSITNPLDPGAAHRIAKAGRPKQLGIPSVSGGRLVFAKATPKRNKLIKRGLGSGKTRVLRSTRYASLSNPSIRGKRLIYVEITRTKQRLRIRGLSGSSKGKTLLQRQRRTRTFYWSTALGDDRVYLTILRPGDDKLISIPR